RQVSPGWHFQARLEVAGCQTRPRRKQAHLQLTSESLVALRVPAAVVATPILRNVLRLGAQRTVYGVMREVQEERFVSIMRAQAFEHADGMIGQIVGQVIAIRVLVDVKRTVV